MPTLEYGNGDQKYQRWWTATSVDVTRTVSGLVTSLRSKQTAKRKLDLNHAKIYGNYDVSGAGHSTASAYELIRGEDGRMRYQLCTAVVDTAIAVVTANKPVPYFLTDGGSWSDQRKAKRKGKLLAGQFMDLKVHKKAAKTARQALVGGTGILVGYVDDNGQPCIENTDPCEWTVDPAEAASGEVRSLFRRRMIAKEQLASLYKKKAGEIRMSEGPTYADWEDRHMRADGTLDMVMVYEAWHLPSREGADDGRHVVCTSHATLVDEAWEYSWFPIATMRWKERLTGWWGCGLVEETKAAQLRINKLIKRADKLEDIGSNIWGFVPKGSGIQDYEITNAPLQLIPFNEAAGAPVFLKQDGMIVGLEEKIERIRQQTFEQVGLSQAQLQGEKPKGLNSAIALRTAEDIGSRRHVDNVRQWENLFVEIAELLERLNDIAAEQAKENGETYYVKTLDTRGRSEFRKPVAWEDVQTDEAASVRMFPVSALGSTPAGKMEAVQELVAGGYLSRPYALKLLDFPDLDTAMALELVDLDLVHWHLERIQDGERGVVPIPQQNLTLAFDESRKVILQAEMLEADESVKRELRRYRSNVEMMLKTVSAVAA